MKNDKNKGCGIEFLSFLLIILGIMSLFKGNDTNFLLFLILIGIIASFGGHNNEKK